MKQHKQNCSNVRWAFFLFFSSTNVETKNVCPIAYNVRRLYAGGAKQHKTFYLHKRLLKALKMGLTANPHLRKTNVSSFYYDNFYFNSMVFDWLNWRIVAVKKSLSENYKRRFSVFIYNGRHGRTTHFFNRINLSAKRKMVE